MSVLPTPPTLTEQPGIASVAQGTARDAGTFVSHAKLIGVVTLLSRLLGMARESIAAGCFGAGAVYSAFTLAFTIPNLFRKLLGEGALSAAFIPLYAQAVKRETQRASASLAQSSAVSASPHLSANDFAAASVNLLCGLLFVITIVAELGMYAATFVKLRPDYLLGLHLTMIMMPYVMLVCGTAFLSGILQVHARFAAAAATSIVLNACHIIAIVVASRLFNLSTPAGQVRGVFWLSWSVLIAGCAQIAILLPSLRAAGFRFRLTLHLFTPAIRRMLKLTLPVALGAGVLQISTMLDKGISFFLAAQGTDTTFQLLGHTVRFPMAEGAAARLNWAQFLYQFPLGVFAIALATAIFPKLASDAVSKHEDDRTTEKRNDSSPAVIPVPDEFRRVLRQGIEASLFIGLPASVGLIVVRYPAVRLLFQRGNFTPADTNWVALSTAIYAAAIWAFSLQQILNRAYYALHDTVTPLVWAIANLLVNTVIELPLIWTRLGESGMAVGTLVSFAMQSVMMLWMLNRRVGGMGLKHSARPIAIMLTASGLMLGVCLALQHSPIYPHGQAKLASAIQLSMLMVMGGLTYFGSCAMMGMDVMANVRRKKVTFPSPSPLPPAPLPPPPC